MFAAFWTTFERRGIIAHRHQLLFDGSCSQQFAAAWERFISLIIPHHPKQVFYSPISFCRALIAVSSSVTVAG